MKRLSLIIVIGLFTRAVIGQTSWERNRDSILRAMSGMRDDSNKVSAMKNLAVEYFYNQPDSSDYFAKEMCRVSRKINFPSGLARGLSIQALVRSVRDQHAEAIALDLEAIDIAEKAHLKKPLADVYNNTAIVYNAIGDFTNSLNLFIKASIIYEDISDSSSLAFMYINIASVYIALQENKSAYAYSLKGVLLCKRLPNARGFGSGMLNLGSSLMNLNRFDTAIIVLDQTRDYDERENDKNGEVKVLADIIYAYEGLDKTDLIRADAEDLISIARSIGDNNGICYGYVGLAKYYMYKKNIAKAGYTTLDAINLASKFNLSGPLREAYLEACNIEIARGNASAYHRYSNLKDSVENVMWSEKVLKNTQELEAKYSLNKKQGEIDNLNKEKQIQQLTLTQRSIMNRALGGLALAIAIVAFLYSLNYRQKKKLLLANSLLHEQRIDELEKEKQLMAALAVAQGQVEERARLAKDLHDGLGSLLSSAKYSFMHMRENMIITAANAPAFERTMGLLDRSISELRSVAHNMMPEALMKFGLDTALRDFCSNVEQSSALKLTYQSYDIEEGSIPATMAAEVYRIIQELVNNILKHADATEALIQVIRKEKVLAITVEDNGKGFDKTILEHSGGMGYLNLRNRVAYLNGSIDIQASPGRGTSVHIEVRG